ncbi:hypothetical protein V8E54_007470 [Elaphomyces granulatus]
MIWFDPDSWCGKEIHFPNTTWVLEKKLDERFRQKIKARSISPNEPGAAWATFVCKQKDRDEGRYIMKIWKQIPYENTEFQSAEARKAQADIDRISGTANEIQALQYLAKRQSKHSPKFIDVFRGIQDDNDIVPTGFVTYIVMTLCPGVPLLHRDWYSITSQERAAVRLAFQEAWLDAIRCGVVKDLPREGDLMWDAPNNKCYFLNFGSWLPPEPSDDDVDFKSWGLFDI